MSNDALIELIGLMVVILNGGLGLVMWGVRNEIRILNQKVDLHVLERIKRLEDEQENQRQLYHHSLSPSISGAQRDVLLLEQRVAALEKSHE